MGRRLRTALAVLALAELVVFVLVAAWIGVGWTILALLATGALGALLLGRQGTKALQDLRTRSRARRPDGRELGNAGLAALGGLLLLLPGFVSDLIGLLCVLPGTRDVVRGVLGRLIGSRLPVAVRGPVRVRSARVGEVEVEEVWRPGPRPAAKETRVIEGEVAPGGPPSA
ncbi:FxsA family protein [Blastococcus sp. SYSU D00669]